MTGLGRDIRGVAGSFRALGLLAGGAFTKQIIERSIDFNTAIARTASLLDLNEAETDALRAAMANLLREFINLGGNADDFGRLLLTNAVRIRALGGAGTAAEKLAVVMSAAFGLAATTGSDWSSSLDDLIGVLGAFEKPAESARDTANELVAAYAASTKPVGDLAKRLIPLGAAAKGAGRSFSEVLSSIAAAPPGTESMVATALELQAAFAKGDTEAGALLERIGALDGATGEVESLTKTTYLLSQAMADGLVTSEQLRAAIDQEIDQEDIDAALQYAKAIDKIYRAEKRLLELTGRAAPEGSGHATRDQYLDANPEVRRALSNRDAIPPVRDIISESNQASGSTGSFMDIFRKNLPQRDPNAPQDYRGSEQAFIAIIQSAWEYAGMKLKGVGIPRLATGGYVPPTPGGRIVRLAEGGEGEWVVPQSKVASFAGGIGGGGRGGLYVGHLTVNAYGEQARDGRALTREMMRALEEEARRRNGGSV